jgi:hypothetical protein
MERLSLKKLQGNNALRRNANAGDRTPASLHAETGDREARGTQARKAVAPAGILDDLADGIEAIHQIANLAGYTERPRAFICALATAAHSLSGEPIEISDKDLANLQGCNERTVQRQRHDYRKESQARNFDLVEIIEGDFDKESMHNLPTKYRFHIGNAVEQIVTEARSTTDWHELNRRQQRDAIARAAARVYKEIRRAPGYRRKQKGNRPATAEIETRMKAAHTNLRRMKEMAAHLPPPQMHAELMSADAPLHKKWLEIRSEMDELFGVDSLQSADVMEDKAGGRQFVVPSPPSPECIGLVAASSLETQTEPEEEPAAPPVSPLPPPESRDTGGAAVAALQAFESVGVREFQITMKREPTGTAAAFKTYTGAELRKSLPGLLKRNEECAESIIVRPRKRAPGLIQADDLTDAEIEKVQPFAFLIAETSPGNFQAWFAVTDADETTRRRLLPVLKADRGASGAMRLPGSRNMKPSRNGFPIRLVWSAPGRTITCAELSAADLLAPLPCPPPLTSSRPRPMTRATRFPNYARCLADKGDDHNRADAAFVKIAMLEGFTDSEAWAELERVAPRPKLQRADYRRRTLSFCSAP